MNQLKIIYGKSMVCQRGRNIRILIILLFAVILGSCGDKMDNAENSIPTHSFEQVRPLDLRVDYTHHDGYHCRLAVNGDSLYFYHVERIWPGKEYIYLMKKHKLEDWQIRNLQQLRDAVAPDSVRFDCNSDWFVTGCQTIILSIDGKSRLYNYGHDLEASIPPALLTLYLYMESISPYNYVKDEWLEYVEYND